ncbi:1422_t:CDS:2, partial [Acaulospora morrowiae]
ECEFGILENYNSGETMCTSSDKYVNILHSTFLLFIWGVGDSKGRDQKLTVARVSNSHGDVELRTHDLPQQNTASVMRLVDFRPHIDTCVPGLIKCLFGINPIGLCMNEIVHFRGLQREGQKDEIGGMMNSRDLCNRERVCGGDYMMYREELLNYWCHSFPICIMVICPLGYQTDGHDFLHFEKYTSVPKCMVARCRL